MANPPFNFSRIAKTRLDGDRFPFSGPRTASFDIHRQVPSGMLKSPVAQLNVKLSAERLDAPVRTR
jgi:hypothetical protein